MKQLPQKEYKIKHDWVEEVIDWELCKKVKFNHMNKCYIYNPESVLKNETHKLLSDFEIQTDHLILMTTPYYNKPQMTTPYYNKPNDYTLL